MELAVLRRLRRVVADQVVRARVRNNLLHRARQIVAIDDGPAVGLIGEHPQRVLRLAQRVVAPRHPDVLVDVELPGRQATRVDGVERGVVAVGGVEDFLHLGLDIELSGHLGPIFDNAVLADGRAAPRRIAHARHAGHRIAELRRQHRGEALADDDHGLAAFPKCPELHGQPFERTQRDLTANPLDGLGGIERIPLLGRVPRLVVELATLEPFEDADDRLVIARQRHRIERSERVHHRQEIAGTDVVLYELDERLARAHAVAEPHVVVVEEEHEDSRILVGGGALFIGAGANGAGRFDRRLAVGLDETERLDGLRLAVFEDLEVGRLEIDDRVALAIRDDRVDADEVDAGPEDGLLVSGRRGLGRGLRRAEASPAAASAAAARVAAATGPPGP